MRGELMKESWASIAAAFISGIALIVSVYIGGHQLPQIHELVNSRLSEALYQIEALQAKVERLGGPIAPPTRAENKNAVEAHD